MFRKLFGRKSYREKAIENDVSMVEYCPSCQAILNMQKDFDPDKPYWICTGCGKMLLAPDFPWDVVWRCDKCGALLNTQKGFHENCGKWVCEACGESNDIDEKHLYDSSAEYETAVKDPLYGMSDDVLLELSCYSTVRVLGDKGNVKLVQHVESGKLYVEKILAVYDKSIYKYLLNNPVKNMPRISAVYEGAERLVVIEEYIPGETLAEIIKEKQFDEAEAVRIAKEVCDILNKLHNFLTPIIHRDVKPSNVICSEEGKVYLLDMDASKWYHADEVDDTKYLGTMGYAAPEQAGFGRSGSSDKTDIYALGMMLNVMVTGAFPKEKRTAEPLYSIIDKCTRLDPEERFNAVELAAVFEDYRKAMLTKEEL